MYIYLYLLPFANLWRNFKNVKQLMFVLNNPLTTYMYLKS